MATSGTIGTTRINSAQLLDKAIRRCGKEPSALTPEIIEQAQLSLFMLLTSLSVRGLNLWCIENNLVGVIAGQATYVLPTGTQDLLNVVQSSHSLVTGTITSTATDYAINLGTPSSVVRYGVKFSAAPTSFQLQTSSDGVTWTTVQTVTDTFTAATTYWFDLDPAVSSAYFRIHSAGQTVSAFLLSTNNREITMAPFNRDDYAAQPNKTFQSTTPLNYFYEKLIEPQFTLWPVPSDDTRCISIWRYRQIQDVGTLAQELELPSRWLEHIVWQLAMRLGFELPGVDPTRLQAIVQMASNFEIEAESGEGDGAPTYYAPGIRGYTA